MAFEFQFPDVGEGIHEGTLVEWLVKEGEAVETDQPFVKVETDKAVVDLPSPVEGKILKLHNKPGDTINVGDVIVTFGVNGESTAQAQKAPGKEAPPKKEAPPPPAGSAPKQAAPTPAPASPGRRPLATPHTRAYARELGIDLAGVTPTGKNGRITDEDVDKAAKGGPAAASPVQATQAPVPPGRAEVTEDGPVERVAASHLRKVIADAMVVSKRTSAHVTHVDEADVTDLMALYKKLKPQVEAGGETRFTLLPLFMKALVAALEQHPLLNASYDEQAQEIVYKKYYHLGMAVDSPEGLIVPVLRDLDRKNMVQIAAEVADKAARARERKLRLDELRGASCSITNIGPLGGVFATPVIHQPELAIVGLHTIKDRPAVVDGEIAIRKLMYLSVSFDHRIIDGAEAARFMTDLVKLVENPGLLMVRL
ncbi:MAG: dihydrolipoamide acetyltransferase family protein [Acidobacteriota bacterium]|jgi:pyruvate dehydrogenase E2 component (dihydrolipoamide acetyltransferase)